MTHTGRGQPLPTVQPLQNTPHTMPELDTLPHDELSAALARMLTSDDSPDALDAIDWSTPIVWD